MGCPHCTINFHEEWSVTPVGRNMVPFMPHSYTADTSGWSWHFRTAVCSKCKDGIIEIAGGTFGKRALYQDWRRVYPIGANRGPVSPEVPAEISQDYIEACNVLPISAKASAALSRRCLQNILHKGGYKVGTSDLAKEIDILLNESDIHLRLRQTIDAIRCFGNFGAHLINDKSTPQIIKVDPHEAEECLGVLEECFEHFYVGPAIAKERKAALDAKLAAAGKPPSK
jgi:hypothetical protein